MKVLVTGGAGFIGSNLVKLLCDKGYKVTVLDDLSSGYKSLVDRRAKFVKGAIGTPQLLDKLLPGQEVVFHLAATSTVTYSLTNPRKYFENNFMAGVALLEGMRRNKVKKIVYSSSASSYGESGEKFLRETDLTNPLSPYGASKYAFEHVLSSYYHSFGINSVSLRYFNVYGPNDEQLGTRAVPRWCQAALGHKPLTLYWNGRQRRDYVFVGDIARANLLASLHCRGCRVYNAGTGRGVWMIDIIKKMEKILGQKLDIDYQGKREGDPKFAMADITKIKKQLKWKPEVNLDLGLKLTLDYFKNRPKKL